MPGTSKALTVLLLLGLLACSPSGNPLEPSIALVTVDTWRNDYMDSVHSPRIWRRSLKGWRFENAWTPIGLTSPAHASIFTALFPWHHGMRANNHHGSVLAAEQLTLAEWLRGQDFSTAAFVSAYPAGPRGGLDQGFQVFSGPESGERPGNEAVAQATRWLKSLPSAQRFFLWVHVYEPHGPYQPPALDLRAMGDGNGDVQRYGAEVHAADRLLKPLWAALDERDPVLVAVTSDHGEVLEEETCAFQHERSSGDQVLRVPMAIWGAGIHPELRHEMVGLVDLAPTLLDLAHLPPMPNTDGQSLRNPGHGRTWWPAESGICESDCAPGCSPQGLLGRDRVLVGPGWRITQRPGRGTWARGENVPARDRWPALLEPILPMTSPQEDNDQEQARQLGYSL